MRLFFRLAIGLALFCGLIVYGYWSQQRPPTHYLSDLRVRLAVNQGVPGNRGNLLGAQPQLLANDYQSLDRLHRKLAEYLGQARSAGLLNPRTVVVLPEHIGTWLMVIGEKPEVYEAPEFEEAMQWLAASNPLDYLKAAANIGSARSADSQLRLKAKSMAKNYQSLFGGLAKEFAVTLVAGSIILPEPRVADGRLRTGDGELFNVSVVFGTDGVPIGQPQRQLRSDPAYQPWASSVAGSGVKVFDTPAGRLGVLIGRDSWSPANLNELQHQGAELLAVPAFIPEPNRWAIAPPSETPDGATSEAQAWRASVAASGARAAICVFSRGSLWDIGSDGHSFVVDAGKPSADTQAAGNASRDHRHHAAALFNLWL